MCQAKYEVLKPCYLTTDEETCNALTYVGSCSDTTIVNESECIGEGIEWTPGQQRCEYKNSNCYPIGETSVETCCQKRTGFCINNYDSNEDYTECSGTYKLTSNIEIKKEMGFAEISMIGSEKEHQSQVKTCIDYIFQGEIFQANLSRQWKFKIKNKLEDIEIYRQLRRKNPSPFSGLITFENSSSRD